MTTTPAPTDLDRVKQEIEACAPEFENRDRPWNQAGLTLVQVSRSLLAELATERRQGAAMASITGEAIRQIGEERDAAREELAKTRAELVTMTAVAKSNKRVTQNMAQELVKALDILIDLTDTEPCSFDHHGYCQAHTWLTDGECPHARAKQLLAENADANPATTAEPADEDELVPHVEHISRAEYDAIAAIADAPYRPELFAPWDDEDATPAQVQP